MWAMRESVWISARFCEPKFRMRQAQWLSLKFEWHLHWRDGDVLQVCSNLYTKSGSSSSSLYDFSLLIFFSPTRGSLPSSSFMQHANLIPDASRYARIGSQMCIQICSSFHPGLGEYVYPLCFRSNKNSRISEYSKPFIVSRNWIRRR